RSAAHNGTFVVILQGSCHDLAGRGGVLVNKYEDLSFLKGPSPGGIGLFNCALLVLGDEDELVVFQEFISNAGGFGKISSGIVAKVKGQVRGALFFKFSEALLEFVVGGFSKTVDPDVSE